MLVLRENKKKQVRFTTVRSMKCSGILAAWFVRSSRISSSRLSLGVSSVEQDAQLILLLLLGKLVPVFLG
jgi:hypothetical protein